MVLAINTKQLESTSLSSRSSRYAVSGIVGAISSAQKKILQLALLGLRSFLLIQLVSTSKKVAVKKLHGIITLRAHASAKYPDNI